MPHQPLPVPLYQRVFGVLLQRITDGTYRPGERLSTETELCAEFGVSKATVRQALAELVSRGLIARRQGLGTFVSEHVPYEEDHHFVGSLADLTIGSRHLPLRHLTLEPGVAFPPRVRDALQTSQDRGTVVRRVREVDGQIFAYTIQYLAPTIENLVTPETLQEYGIPTLLHQNGIVLTGAKQSTSARLADVEVSQRLEVELGAPVLYAERVLFSEDGPVEVVRGWYRCDLYHWQASFTFRWDEGRLVIYSDEVDAFPK